MTNSMDKMEEAQLNPIICCWWVSLVTPDESECDNYRCKISVRSIADGKTQQVSNVTLVPNIWCYSCTNVRCLMLITKLT